MDSDKQLCQLGLSLVCNGLLLWTYECDNKSIFMLGTGKETTPLTDTSEDTPQQKTKLFRAEISSEEKPIVNLKLVTQFDVPILGKNYLATSSDLLVICSGKKLTLVGKFKGHSTFFSNIRFDTIDSKLILFNDVRLVEDTLYASLSVGRVYIW